MSFYGKIYSALEKIIFPNDCFECSKPSEQQFCSKCFDRLFYPQIRSFVRGGVRIRVLSAMKYSSGVAKLINCKFGQKPKSFDLAGQIMAKAISSQQLQNRYFPGVLVPVPSHWTKALLRGFNQSEILAQAISKASGLEVSSLLIKTRSTASQASTGSRLERLANVKNCFSINPEVQANELKNQNIILVDDLVTSGATLLQCAKTISGLTNETTINALVLSAKDVSLKD